MQFLMHKCFLMAGLCLPLFCGANDGVVMRHGGTELRQSDIVRAVKSFVPPEQVGMLFADEKKLRDTIARVFVQRKLAEEAQSRVLSSEEKGQVEDARLRALSQLQIEYLLAKRPEPNFEAAAKEAYLAKKESYATSPRVHVEHILVSTKVRSEEEALSRAEMVRGAVLKGDRAFADLAKEYSDDPSASRNGGDLDFFPRGAMVKPFEDMAFSMTRKGQVSEPVKTDFGFHVIRFIDSEPAGYTPFDQVKDKLIKEEKAKFRTKVLGEEFERVSKVTDVFVDQEAIKAMVVPMDKLPRR